MVARWMARLAAFDYDIVHRPGVLHGHADGLSRRKGRACKRLDCKECMPLRVDGKMTMQERCYPVPGGLEDEAVHGQDVEDEDVGMEAMFVPPTKDQEVPVRTVMTEAGPGLDADRVDPVQAAKAGEEPWLRAARTLEAQSTQCWPGNRYTMDQIKDMQLADPEIAEFVDVWKDAPVKPQYQEIAARSAVFKT